VKARLSVVTALVLVGAAPAAAAYCETNDWDCQRREAEQKAANDAANEEYARQRQVEREQLRRALLKQPPLPAERNGLLGSWRLDDGPQGQTASILGPMIGGGSGADTGLGGAMADIANMVMGLEKGMCGLGFGSGVTFSPSSYSSQGEIPVAYRAGLLGGKPAIAAIPDDSQQDMMVFAIASPDRIVGEDSCVLVRVGKPAINAAANATNAPGNARAAASGPSSPPTGAVTPTAAAGRASEPIDPTSPLGRGVQLHRVMDFQPALQQLLLAAQSDPDDPRVYVYLADSYAWLGENAAANQAAERAKQLDPNAFEILPRLNRMAPRW
jgi:tetratricopeptide (TPR) repeat protein